MRLVQKMEIDEAKDVTPYHVEMVEGHPERKYTDHFMITVQMNIKCIEEKGGPLQSMACSSLHNHL